MKNLSDRKVIIIYGPTATGKTALALQLARKFSDELTSTVYNRLAETPLS